MATYICRGFTNLQWRSLRSKLVHVGSIQADELAWNCAIDVFERRIKERFLSCIEALQRLDSRADVMVAEDAPADGSSLPNDGDRDIIVPGFAIMALCCLLIETLAFFRKVDGNEAELKQTDKELIASFLRRRSFEGAFDDERVASRFVSGIRNGILHEAETRRWVIWRNDPVTGIVERASDNRFKLNRSTFYQALRSEFELYISELRNPGSEALRRRFLEKMNDIAKTC
jgi:hypothetical protein